MARLSSFVLSKVKLHQLLRPESGEGIGLSRVITELDRVRAILPSFNYCSDFPTAQSMLLDVLG